MGIENKTDRRSFLKTSVGAGAAVAAAFPVPHVMAETAKGANERIGVGFIGVGGRSGAHQGIVQKFQNQGVVQPVAVCDVYRPRLEAASKRLGNAKMYDEHEKLLDDPNVDAVCIATPDAHHAPQAIDALNAKKDVYCEKPLTHWNQFELAKQIDAAAKKNDCLVQVGTQYMADDNYPTIRKMIEDGAIGKPVHAQCAYMRRGDWGERMTIPDPNATPGPDLNWERFLGSSPKVPFSVSRFFQWRLYWDYAGGPVTDWGAHHNDIARWAIGQDGPISVESKATVAPIAGGYTTCKEFEAVLEYAGDIQQIVKTTTADSPFGGIIDPNGQRNGVRLTGTDGWIWVNRGDLNASKEDIYMTPLPDNAIRLEESNNHMANFFDCVRTRKDPVASVENGHRSAVVGHLIIIAMHEGRKLKWDPAKEIFTGDGSKEANTHLSREMRKPYDYSYVG